MTANRRVMQDEAKSQSSSSFPSGIDKEALSKLSFEEALARLERVVATLEQGNLPLEEAVFAFEEGNLLRQHCEKKLSEAKLKIEKVIQTTQNGEVALESLAHV